jgi:hypothetical protein
MRADLPLLYIVFLNNITLKNLFPVAGPSGCILTSNQQSADPNGSPCLCCWFILKLFTDLIHNCFKYYLRIQSVPQRKQYFTITEISWLTLFREIAVYSENHTKPTDILRGQNKELSNIKAGGIYTHH